MLWTSLSDLREVGQQLEVLPGWWQSLVAALLLASVSSELKNVPMCMLKMFRDPHDPMLPP